MLLSVNKILVLIAILLVVWYGFKLVGRLDRARREKVRSARRAPDPDDAETIELVRDEEGTGFVPRGTRRR